MPAPALTTPAAPRFSVVTTSYRSLRFLEDCMSSVFSAAGDFEVLFLDNGSPQPEAEFMRDRFQGEIERGRLRVFKERETRYFAGGMNFLAARARGEFVVLLSSDTWVEPDWLAKLDAYLRETGFELAQADLREPGNPKRLLGYNLDRMGMNREIDEREIPPSGRIFCACGAAFTVRRDVFEELGGLDESFRMYFEDLDLCWRANLYGYRVGLASGAIVHHVGGGSARKSFFPWVLFRNIRNRNLCFVKNAGPLLLAQFLVLNALLRLFRLPVNLATGKLGVACAEVAAVASFFWLLPGALARRFRIQSRRTLRDADLFRLGYITRGMKYFRLPGSGKP
jgi:GT2 family glycosyltransferase